MEKQFLIIGQGIAGSLLAYGMYKAGMKFTIVSSLDLHKVSDVAAGMYNPLVFKRLTKSWMADKVLPVMFEIYRELENEFGEQFLFPKDILKPLSDHEIEIWKEKMDRKEFADYIGGIEYNGSGNGLKEFQSYGRVTNSGYLDLSKLLKKMRIFFKEQGFLVESQFNYKDLGFINGQITWHGILVQTLVFCEGYHATNNPYFKTIGFNLTKGELLEIECPGLQEEYIINKNLFVLPIGEHRFKVGATYEWKQLDEEITAEAKSDLLTRLEGMITLPYKVINHWAGIRPTVIDRRPVLGTHPLHNHVAIFNGLGTKGVMLAPYFAREMVRFLSMSDYPLMPEIDVKRFLKD